MARRSNVGRSSIQVPQRKSGRTYGDTSIPSIYDVPPSPPPSDAPLTAGVVQLSNVEGRTRRLCPTSSADMTEDGGTEQPLARDDEYFDVEAIESCKLGSKVCRFSVYSVPILTATPRGWSSYKSSGRATNIAHGSQKKA